MVMGQNGELISGYTERDLEQAVIDKLYQEEETQEIQHMIAKFYDKFDELHEQSVGQTLSKGPNKEQLRNDVKYRIPERWTKKFNKYDVIDINIYNKVSGIVEDRGKVNRPNKAAERNAIQLNIMESNLQQNSDAPKEPSQIDGGEKKDAGNRDISQFGESTDVSKAGMSPARAGSS